MKKQRREDRIMRFVGILMIILSIVGIIWFLRLISNEKSKTPFPTDIPSDIPADVPLLNGTIGASEQVFLVNYGTRVLKVEFPQVESIKRLWSGSVPMLIIENPFSASYYGKTKTDSWGSPLLTSSYSYYPFTPWLTVPIKLDEKYQHQWIYATARLDILYPVFAPGNFATGFTNKKASIEHSLRFFIVSPEEYNLVSVIRRGTPKPDNITPIIMAVTCLFLPGILLIFLSSLQNRL